MIKVENISKSFDKKQVLNQISFEIKESELAVIYGTNGAGKTTLIKILAGLVKEDDGNVFLNPSDKNKISLFLGHEALIPKLKVKEYLSLVGNLKEVGEIKSKIDAISNKLNFDAYLNDLITNISFGTKTKVLFAACLLNEPRVLIMDEPFIGVDLIVLDELVKILNELKSKGTTILISSHQVDILENIIDRVLILNESKIILDDESSKLPIDNFRDLPSFIISKLTK